MKTARGRFVRIALLSISIIAIAAFWWSAYLHNGSLVRNGHRIGLLEGQSNQYTPTPEWISDHEAIYLRYHFEGDRFEFIRVDTDTGVSTPISELNERYRHELVSSTYNVRSVPHPVHVPPNVALSPAHNLLLISPNKNTTFGFPTHHLSYHVADLCASRDITWKDTSPNQYNFYPPLWLGGENGWLLSRLPDSDVRASLYSVREPSTCEAIRSSNSPVIPWIMQHVTHDDRIWGFTQKSFGSPINVSIWDIAGASQPETYKVMDPVNGYVRDTALSKETDRVAWLITYWHLPPTAWIKERLFGSKRPIPKNASNMFGIWVSDLHGNHMHELGREQFSIASIFGDSYMRWLPGGKKLAFHIGGELYTIPVDE